MKRTIAGYETILRITLKGRYLFVILFLCVFAAVAWYGKTHMKLILFPTEGIEAFFVRAELERNTQLDTTSEKFRAIEQVVSQLGATELRDYVAHIGLHRDDHVDPFAQRGSHLGQIQVFLTPEKDRDRTAEEISEDLRLKLEPLKKKHGLGRD